MPADIEFYRPICRRERTLHVYAGKSASVSLATTNHIVAAEVNHAHNTMSRVTANMAEKREFDLKLIETVKLTPVLWDSHLDDYKLAEKKPALWLEIADKLGSDAGRKPIPFYLCNKNFTIIVWHGRSEPNASQM